MFNAQQSMIRVSKKRPCPICGKPDWCLTAPDGSAAICPRIAEGSVKLCGEAGFLHVLRDHPCWRDRPKVRTIRTAPPDRAGPDLGPLAAECAAAIHTTELQEFAEELGLTIESLVRLRIGWVREFRAWSFPMHSVDMNVRGIRLRSWTGRKWAIKGGREGLFIPTGLDFSDLLLVWIDPRIRYEKR